MAMFSLASAGLLRPPNIRGQYDPRRLREASQERRGLLRTLFEGPRKKGGNRVPAARAPAFVQRPMVRNEIVRDSAGMPWIRQVPVAPYYSARPTYPVMRRQAKPKKTASQRGKALEKFVFGEQAGR